MNELTESSRDSDKDSQHDNNAPVKLLLDQEVGSQYVKNKQMVTSVDTGFSATSMGKGQSDEVFNMKSK